MFDRVKVMVKSSRTYAMKLKLQLLPQVCEVTGRLKQRNSYFRTLAK